MLLICIAWFAVGVCSGCYLLLLPELTPTQKEGGILLSALMVTAATVITCM